MRGRARKLAIKARMVAEAGGCCHWCDRPVQIVQEPWKLQRLPDDLATIDHVYPRKDPRRTELEGKPGVITTVIACRPCNGARGDMAYNDFLWLMRPEWRDA